MIKKNKKPVDANVNYKYYHSIEYFTKSIKESLSNLEGNEILLVHDFINNIMKEKFKGGKTVK